MAKVKVDDESGDRDFFTIVPNIVINHSTAIDRALYLEMKRFAGASGECFATEKTMMSRMGIGKKAFNKSLDYLLKREWISFVGLTNGKTRPIKTYKINDIWKENSVYKEKISAERTLSRKNKEISAESALSEEDKFQKHTKISAESTVEEDTIKEDKTYATPKVVAPFQWDEYLKRMDADKQESIQLIAFFFRERKIRFDSLEEVKEGIARHVRMANRITKAFPRSKVFAAFDKVKQQHSDIDWSLETVYKKLTN